MAKNAGKKEGKEMNELEKDLNQEQSNLEQNNQDNKNGENQNPTNQDNQDNNNQDVENSNDDKPSELNIHRTTAIEKVHVPRTIRQIVKNKKQLRFDLCIQRGNAWSLEQKSTFIHSLIYGFPFPPAYAQDLGGDGKELWLLDGKQRLSTIISFCEDGFKLSKNTPKVFGVEIGQKRFSQLPKEFQDEILDTSFTIYQLRGMTDEERDEMFVRLNKGTPLSKIQTIRAMYSDLMPQIESIQKMEFFTNHAMLSSGAKNNFTDVEIILQTAMLLDDTHDNKGIGSAQIQAYVVGLKKKDELLSNEVFKKFIQADDYLSSMANGKSEAELKLILKKVNIPMVIVTSLRAFEKDIDESVFGDFLKDFLIENYSKDTAYGEACQSGSAKKENVEIRLNEMDKAFTEYVNSKLNLKGEEKLVSKHEELLQKQVG